MKGVTVGYPLAIKVGSLRLNIEIKFKLLNTIITGSRNENNGSRF